MAEHDHGQGVADEDGVDAGRVRRLRGGEVVGGDHGDGLAAAALVSEGEDGGAGRGCVGSRAHLISGGPARARAAARHVPVRVRIQACPRAALRRPELAAPFGVGGMHTTLADRPQAVHSEAGPRPQAVNRR